MSHGRSRGGGIGFAYVLLGFVVGAATENTASMVSFFIACVLLLLFKFAGSRH